MMSDKLQIPRSLRVVHDAVNVHLLNFEKIHREHFTYDCVKEGFQIQRFELRFERRPYHTEYRDRDVPDLGSVTLRPLGTSLTEVVIEDSPSLEVGPGLFLGIFNPVKLWEDDEDEEHREEPISLEQAKTAASARFDQFKTIHQEVRESIIEGLREDGILLGKQKIASAKPPAAYVNKSRIAELRQISSPSFDLQRLIRLCEELNKCFASNSFCATAALIRAVIDHVPPIFGARTFAEVVNNVGGKSIKASIERLETSSRHIADSVLHQQIRKREAVPNGTQVNFSNDLDVLLAEIIRRLA